MSDSSEFPGAAQTTDGTSRDTAYRSVDWVGDALRLIDQRKLPASFDHLDIVSVDDLVVAIKRLSVRGAPAIGVAGAFGVYLAVREHGGTGDGFARAIQSLRSARPTAVNLARMVDRVAAVADQGPDRVLEEARAIRDEELAASIAMGRLGADLVAELAGNEAVSAMTICNTGGLAAVERGTALAVIQELHERGQLGEVLACETRPLLQGARLTMWELERMQAPAKLIVDSAGPALIARGVVDFVIAGADRIAANGDSANKIGTYSLSLAAARAGVPFVIVAPESTVDLDVETGALIQIEDRGSDEVIGFAGKAAAPTGSAAMNPAFDVTPADLITAIVTDRRVVRMHRGETFATVPRSGARSVT